jgi:hypothetical protein
MPSTYDGHHRNICVGFGLPPADLQQAASPSSRIIPTAYCEAIVITLARLAIYYITGEGVLKYSD